MENIQETVQAWGNYLRTISDWEELVTGIEPKLVGCGAVYELQNPIDRPGESFAVADMRQLELAEPHRHLNGEIEIYFVLQGTGRVGVGDKLYELSPGSTVVIPPDTIHITKPGSDLILAVVNTPPFEYNNYDVVDLVDPEVSRMITLLTQSI